MGEVRSCPVCGRQGIQAQSSVCPQCDADLLCFQALDSLAAAPATPPTARQPRFLLALSLILLCLLFILGGLLLHTKKQLKFLDQHLAAVQSSNPTHPALAEARPAPLLSTAESLPQQETPLTLSNVYKVDAQIKIVNTWEDYDRIQSEPVPVPEPVAQEEEQTPELSAGKVKVPVTEEEKPVLEVQEPPRKAALVLLQGQPKRRIHQPKPSKLDQEVQARTQAAQGQLRPPAPVQSTVLYQSQDGETLRQVAARFYGDEGYYPVLMEQNPGLTSFARLKKETQVRVFTDRRQAQRLYQQKIEQRDGLLLWNYTVQQGETWRSIYARFFPPRYSGRVFYAKNPEITPGKTVQIILR
jgi:hypothetical protein